jgi:hypothetical protein
MQRDQGGLRSWLAADTQLELRGLAQSIERVLKLQPQGEPIFADHHLIVGIEGHGLANLLTVEIGAIQAAEVFDEVLVTLDQNARMFGRDARIGQDQIIGLFASDQDLGFRKFPPFRAVIRQLNPQLYHRSSPAILARFIT